MTASKTLINGQPSRLIDIADRGLQYGDGVFETLAVVNGKALQWSRHLDRLLSGCERLHIPFTDIAQLESESNEITQALPQGVLKIIITRGQGPRGYASHQCQAPTRILGLLPWPNYPTHYRQAGVSVRLCQTRLAHNNALAGIKHLNRLDQVMARAEWQDDYQEGLMLDSDGNVIAGTMSNLFLVKDKALYTPELSRCGIAGIMRGLVLENAASLGIETHIAAFKIDALETADELFLTNSLIGLWPVRKFGDMKFNTGALTRKIQDGLRDAIA